MIKTIRTTIAITMLMSGFAISASAQIGYNYSKYDFGVAGAMNLVYGDAETLKYTRSYHVNFTYNQTPYVNYIAEFQAGKLAGGDSLLTLSGRQFSNNFFSLAFRAQLQAGEFLNYEDSFIANTLKNFYLGGGVGIIYNNIKSINRYSANLPGFYSPGEDKSENIFLPARVGYELKLFNSYNEPFMRIDLAYQLNYVLGDGIDGYSVGRNDVYTQYTIGFKFALGGEVSYRKQIHR